jgi:phage gp36-like protein
MSTWITLTAAHLEDAKLAPLLTALRSAALGDSQDDPVANILTNVTNRIRAEIRGCASNLVDSDTTKIPADLKSLAARMCFRELASRLQQPLNDDEREEARQDIRYLERIAKCEVPIATPDNPVAGETQPATGKPRITARTRRFGSEDGL